MIVSDPRPDRKHRYISPPPFCVCSKVMMKRREKLCSALDLVVSRMIARLLVLDVKYEDT